MKKILMLSVFLFAGTLAAQTNPIFLNSSFNTATASAPTFSPVAGAVTNPTTVTASSTTTGTGCTIYFDTNPTPTTAQTTYSVTTAVTLYAQVRGCSGYSDSSVSSAAYTMANFGCPTGSGSCFDNFVGSANTLLTTYNSAWTWESNSGQHGYLTGSSAVYGNTTAQYAVVAYSYSGSTADVSEVTVPATVGNSHYVQRGPCVRLVTPGSGIGYCASLYSNATGTGSTGQVRYIKSYNPIGTTISSSVNQGVDHTLRITASGTSTVTLTFYLDGISVGTATDSSSTFTSGNPGFYLDFQGATGLNSLDTQLSKWTDYAY